MLAILLPNIFVSLIGGKTSFIRRLFTPACVAIFFPGLIAYPLSDLPAICLIITSLALIVYASKQNSLLCGIALALFSGVASYGCVQHQNNLPIHNCVINFSYSHSYPKREKDNHTHSIDILLHYWRDPYLNTTILNKSKISQHPNPFCYRKL